MKTVSLQLPETVFAALCKPDEFVQEMRVAAVKWYELGEISQSKAAEIAGLTRSEFINALSQFKFPLQYTAQELAEELADADWASCS